MRYRMTDILVDGDPGAATGTKIINIDAQDVISQLIVRFHATAGSTTISEHPASNITKCEIIDGSEVLYSLTGQCAEAMDFYGIGQPRVNRIYYRNGQPWVSLFHINFGRFPGDRELAFDPKRFTNPQLKITYNEDVSNTAASARSMFVKALCFDEEPPSPMGFLMLKEQKSYTPTANAYEYTDLPTDYPYRTLAIQARKTGTRFGATVDQLKISEDNDKRIPYDDKASILAQLMGPFFGWYQEHIIAYVGTGATNVYCTPGLDVAMGLACMGNNYAVQGNIAVGCVYSCARATAAGFVQANLGGWLPHHVLALPFGARNDLNDWYDVMKIGSLKLTLKGGASLGASDTIKVITEQLRRY